MFKKKTSQPQQSLWLSTAEIVDVPQSGFYQKLNEALDSFGFGDKTRALCAPYYCQEQSLGGRPGIDPEVYFKMLMVGFFENLPSERGIAARCADSLSIRTFLRYELSEQTPDHSSLSKIRHRYGAQVYRDVFALALSALRDQGLLKGKRLGIDASTIEANASLRTLEHRLSGEEYWQYVKKLAAEAGIDPEDGAAVRRFDKKRPGKSTSNKDWKNPHDPDAKIGRTKRGATRMIYKPENLVDLDTGAIVDPDIRPGDEHDTSDLAERVLAAEYRMRTALGFSDHRRLIESLTGDKGYFKLDEIVILHQQGIKTVIGDSVDLRRPDLWTTPQRAAYRAAQRSVNAKYGKELLRRRGQYIERSFAHMLDDGGARRTTLRGRDNVTKRYLITALGYNLSLLIRALTGVGTPKQALAKAGLGIESLVLLIVETFAAIIAPMMRRPTSSAASMPFGMLIPLAAR